ncbi:MAG: NAD(P)-binding domain-containing protein [Actinomycetota bacterium]|nr:NAD(P)-binding domain-containing protein [Actinomycetota bacterium]
MATRLVNAGHDVTVWNRPRARTASLARAGASVAESPAEAATGAEFAITMLANPEALDGVLFGPGGLAPALASGQTWIDMSTVGPDAFRAALARRLRGAGAVDAPVRGSVVTPRSQPASSLRVKRSNWVACWGSSRALSWTCWWIRRSDQRYGPRGRT